MEPLEDREKQMRKWKTYKGYAETLKWLESGATPIEIFKRMYPEFQGTYLQRQARALLIKDYNAARANTKDQVPAQ